MRLNVEWANLIVPSVISIIGFIVTKRQHWCQTLLNFYKRINLRLQIAQSLKLTDMPVLN